VGWDEEVVVADIPIAVEFWLFEYRNTRIGTCSIMYGDKLVRG
jgi:hypothetical protein